jgi:hypothetical protein
MSYQPFRAFLILYRLVSLPKLLEVGNLSPEYSSFGTVFVKEFLPENSFEKTFSIGKNLRIG